MYDIIINYRRSRLADAHRGDRVSTAKLYPVLLFTLNIIMYIIVEYL